MINPNIGDFISVKVGKKIFNGIVLDNKDNIYTIIYVGKNDLGKAFAITDNFSIKDIVVD